jgi:acyl transferase domain-containing protein/3-hydroxymyristoyl/3-hydroxydecanoyl-(acyl carrier protein) dehydratase
MSDETPIAVVGMAGLFPGALDADRLWANICAQQDAAADAPRARWIAAPEHMVGTALEPDTALNARCCLLTEFAFRPDGLDLDPDLLRPLDPLYHALLHAGRDAISGRPPPRINREKTGVVLAALVLPTEAASTFTRELLGALLEGAAPPPPGPPTPAVSARRGQSFAGRVAGLPAAILAKAFGLKAGSLTLDAACASSLYALKLACDELRAGRVDAMVAGGVSRPDCLFTQVGFSQLKALSPSGRCAPFDRSADGLVVGEGAGLLVLKRLSDALADQDPIFGLIRGIGLSNDLRGNLLAPDSNGQLRAMRAAYAAAGWSPSDVDYIECHGAGTPVGDAVELESLRRLWGEAGWAPEQCALGSVKSMIGHLLTAAGAAATIKTLMGFRHATLPPTLHFRQAPANSPLAGGPFRVQTTAEPWKRRTPKTPRRAAVSAFGFGGINAHMLLEEWDPAITAAAPPPRSQPKIPPPLAAAAALAPHPLRTGPGALPAGADSGSPPVAIVGMAACLGGADSLAAFRDAVLTASSLIGPRPAGRWKHCDRLLPDLKPLAGGFLEEFRIEAGRFRIPPREIPDILPQQLLMLNVAADALLDAGLDLRQERPRAGAVIGIDFDFEATNFHLRWLLRRREAWRHLDSPQAREWLARAQDACSPPLTASRVLGALGSMVASRIAREFRLGGPSFTVSAGEASGVRALAIAVRALQASELDWALAGAVDLCGDLRAVALHQAVRPFSPSVRLSPFDPAADGTLPGEGAVALVLKRLDRALADRDRVIAVVRGIGAAGGGGIDSETPSRDAYRRSLAGALAEARVDPAGIGCIEAHGSGIPAEDALESELLGGYARSLGEDVRPGSAKSVCGHTGAAAGLVSVVKAALCVCHDVIPPRVQASGRRPPPRRFAAPAGAAPRRALAACMTDDGNCMHVVLESAGSAAAWPTKDDRSSDPQPPTRRAASIRIPAAGAPLIVPPFPSPTARPPVETAADRQEAAGGERGASLIEGLAHTTQATACAHRAFLDLSGDITRRYAEALRVQAGLISAAPRADRETGGTRALPVRPAFDRSQCLEFARGSAAKVLGPEFADVDTFPARVRLPDEPLMLVDRILEVHGAKGALGAGRVVTEHDVLPGAWYLDGDRAPVCIAVEAGQADLFLCAYLGIDRRVRGRRTYRLLDATVEFHRGLPQPGETVRYEIEIEKFLRQGDTYLFLFHFRGTIQGAPLITMTNGCAGFFTPEEVDRSGGIILTDEDRQPRAGRRPPDGAGPVPLSPGSYDDRALDALRQGDLAACFGRLFEGVHLPEPLRLAGGRMKLIDRILEVDPAGGRYGLGRIRAEADIRPDAWFLTCHFVDDMVMPGTLMYECCAHALRVFVQRLGWITDAPGARYEPLPGLPAALKCRGPVTPRTRSVVYQVDIKELGYGPEPYAVADADMLADGRHIVRFTDMSIRLAGATREEIDAFWRQRRPRPEGAALSPPPALFPRSHFVEFARGRPSRAFGARYRPFDTERFIARLPAPPYLFIDRITAVEPSAWELKPGGWIEAELDVPPGAWYIRADRCRSVPYCVLLEAALQPCGWLAAYMGSALRSEKPLHFRNLGGQATLHRDVRPDCGTLRTRTRMRRVSEVTDMIIQHFEFDISAPGGRIYDGSTYFGFFTPAALERQEGIRDAASGEGSPPTDAAAQAAAVRLAAEAPLTPDDPGGSDAPALALPAGVLRMVDRIDRFMPGGGPAGLGFLRGAKTIDPQEWFFRAHFYQDPVCPGSLGIEGFLQLLKFAARERWPRLVDSHRFTLQTGKPHRWTYRGQVLPTNREVTVEASISAVTESPHPALEASGILWVDGLPIYRMEHFGIRLVPVQ